MSLYDRDYMRDGEPSGGLDGRRAARGFSAFHAVVVLNAAVFIAQHFLELGWERDLLSGRNLLPEGTVRLHDLEEGRVWGMITHMFVHAGFVHFLIGMLLLWFAGRRVQEIFGEWRFLEVYVLSAVVGASAQLAVEFFANDNRFLPMAGSSAAGFGLLLAFAAARPREQVIGLLYFVIPIRTTLRKFALVVVGLNVALGVAYLADALPTWLRDGQSVTAYFAHLGGAAAGWFLGCGLRQQRQLPSHSVRAPSMRKRRPELARVARRPVVDLDEAAVREQNPTKDPVVDLMRDEVDPILDKISEQGMHSLTDDERRTLERASRQILRRDRKS